MKSKEKLVSVADLQKAISLIRQQVSQQLYNGIYPVGNIQFGLQAPAIPNGVTATWTDVSSSYEGKFFKIVAGSNPGTVIAESGTANSTVLTVDQMPSHDHRASTSGNVGYTDWRGDHTHYHQGAVAVFEYNTGTGTRYDLATAGNYEGGRDLYQGSAGGHWHRAISNGGGKGHTHTLSGISPVATSIKVWKRTA